MFYFLRTGVRVALGIFFIFAGAMHFLRPQPFVDIVPAYLPKPCLLVYLSGFFEMAGGAGLFIPRLRRLAAYGLIALLVAVFPANIYMLTNRPEMMGQPVPRWILLLRLPLQGVLMAVVWWAARENFIRAQRIETE